MLNRTRHAMIGGILGLGAPFGALVLRVFMAAHEGLAVGLLREWEQARFFYNYMTIGTMTVFAAFGFILGWRSEGLTRSAITDGLTRIYNHRYLHERLDQEIERSNRYHAPLTCLMLDIDDFKTVNDQFGHPFGDQVLVDIARMIRQTMRRTDLAGRYGGEEFLVIMPQTGTEEAIPIADRLVSLIAEHDFVLKGVITMHVTISVGLATYPSPEHGITNKSSLLSAADQSLYRSKRTGKNKATVWQA